MGEIVSSREEHTYTFMNVITINEKGNMNLKESKKYRRGLGGKGEEMI